MIAFVIVFLIIAVGHTNNSPKNVVHEQINEPINLNQQKEIFPIKLSSPVFLYGESIPTKYTCNGEDINPSLLIENISTQVKTLVLAMEDPDAPTGTWNHWIAFNIAPSGSSLEIPEGDENIGTSGRNSWEETGYSGPCPPSGVHHYVFTVYALNQNLQLNEGASKQQILGAMQGHVINNVQLIGIYEK